MENIIPTKQCTVCNTTIVKPINCSRKNWGLKLYCSMSCHKKAQTENKIKIQCSYCCKEFNVSKSKSGQKFCSKVCRAKVLPPPSQGTITGKICITCGKEFFVKGIKLRERQVTCSRQCRKGILHPNWKGGKTPENHRLRNTTEYSEWRHEVYKRDYWTCQMCKEKQKQLVAHHIKSFNEYHDLRYTISNGITLCRACHKRVHSEIGISTRFIRK